jgi:NAD(P)-dependent dehydrogenase (short-subunit alcohol dehydrogenase family)
MKNLFDLNGLVAVVTGAGGAMGSVIADGLASYGADVVVIGHSNKERMPKTIESIRSKGRKALECYCDVTSQDDVDRIVSETMDNFGHVDIYVNCPGYSFRVNAEDIDIKNWETLMDINLTGTFRCTQAFGRIMIEQKKGSIIIITSIAGMVALGRGQAAYCSSNMRLSD